MSGAFRRGSRGGIAAAACWVTLLLAGAVGAQPQGLAAPGPCAEPRQKVHAEPLGSFEVSGGPREHFDPNQVSAGPPPPRFEQPEPRAFERMPCDAPQAGCPIAAGRTSVSEPPPGQLPQAGDLQ